MDIKRFSQFVLLTIILASVGTAVPGQELKVISWNIRYDNPGDGENRWVNRREWLCRTIQSEGPGVFGLQEGLIGQLRYIDSVFSTYGRAGKGREDGREKGEFCAIYFNKDQYVILREGTFWLSPTPEKVSVGWDAALPRICTWVFLKEKSTGQKFWVLNTHFDHMGEQARLHSAETILKKAEKMNRKGFPMVLMGDFNADPGSEPVKRLGVLFTDAKTADKSMAMGPDGTFNGFDPKKPATERIDFIFSGYGAKAVEYHVIREQKEGRFASDHFPVVARVQMPAAIRDK